MSNVIDINVEKFKAMLMEHREVYWVDGPFSQQISDGYSKQLFDIFSGLSADQTIEIRAWLLDESDFNAHIARLNQYLFTCYIAPTFDNVDENDVFDLIDENYFDDQLENKEDDQVISWIADSVNAHNARMERLGGDPGSEIEIDVHINKGTTTTSLCFKIFLIFDHLSDHRILWDERSFEIPGNVSAASFLSFVNSVADNAANFTCYPHIDSVDIKDFPLSKYHPVRFEKTRKYLPQISSMAREHGIDDSRMSGDLLNIIGSVMAMNSNNQTNQRPLRQTEHLPVAMNSDSINRELERYVLFNSFRHQGKKIFDLNETLVDMFHHTDFTNIPVSFLSSPFTSYYIHFGAHDWLKNADGLPIDGVYVEHYPDAKLIQFCFTTKPKRLGDNVEWASHGDASFSIAIGDSDYDLSLDKALESVLEQRRASILEKMARGDRDATQDLRDEMIKAGESPDILKHSTIIMNDATNATYEMERLERTIESYRIGLALVANAMLYLTAYPDDIDLDWGEGTPRSLVEKAEKGHPKIKENNASKLASLGYRKVYLCGRKLNVGPMADAATGDGTSSSKRTHWRRLHWRLQPYGKDRALRKAILISPVLINPGAGFADDEGTIYIDKNVVNMKDAKKRLNITSKRYWE